MTPKLSLYTSDTCGYCAQVNYVAKALDVELEQCDVRDAEHRAALSEAVGRSTVPVLRVEDDDGVRWLPESLEIIRYLKQRSGRKEVVPGWVDQALGPAMKFGPLLVLGSFIAGEPIGPVLAVVGFGWVVLALVRRAMIMRV